MGKPKITNKKQALAAVRQNGWALEYVPESLKTAELCLEAVKQDGRALHYVPWGQLKLTVPAMADLCLEAVEKRGSLKYVPDKLKTAEMCLKAVKLEIMEFFNVPEELKTQELCLKVAKCCGFLLSAMPKKVLTAEICFEAMKHDIYAYREGRLEKVDRVEKEVPEDLQDEVRSMLASWRADRESRTD